MCSSDLDVGRLDQQVEADLGPVFAQLIVDPGEIAPQAAPNVAGEEAPVRSALEPVPAIEDDPPPHLSYAAQWFIFTIIALVGYPLILRRSIRQHELDSFDDLDDLDDPPGSGDAHTPDPPPIPDQALTGSSRPRVSN